MTVFVLVLIWSPMWLVAISMIWMPRLWSRFYERRQKYAPIKTPWLQIHSDSAWRVLGVALIGVIVWFIWYLMR